MYGSLDISVGGMVAQRTRLTTIAANIASSHAILDGQGNPSAFQRKIVMLQAGDPNATRPGHRNLGVHVAAIEDDDAPPRLVYDPSHPYAKPEGHPNAGYVEMPNINSVNERIDAMEAVRAYEANVAAAEASKALTAQALRMIA